MTSVEVTFLGTTAGVPTKQRNHAAIHILYRSENEFSYLFDCGEGTQRQMLAAGINFMRINEIFITHWHADHFAGLLGLLETMNLEGREKPLAVFAPEAERFVGMLLDLGYSTKDFPVEPRNIFYEGTGIQTLLETNEFFIKSTPAKHGIPAAAYAFVEKDRVNIDKEKIKKLGMPPKGPIYKKIKDAGSVMFKGKEIKLEEIARIEKGKKIVYSGDTLPCKNVIKLAENADLLIHDSTFFEDEKDGKKHASVDDVLKIAEEANVKEIILTHISRRYQDTDELKDKVKDRPNVKIAKDFMRITI